MDVPAELRTERLYLRPWRPDDRAPFAALNADPRVMESRSDGAWPRSTGARATRLKRAVEALRFGFDDLFLDEIVSFTSVGNAKSRRVMTKVGMTRNPEDDFD